MSPTILCDIEAALVSAVLSKYAWAGDCEFFDIIFVILKTFGSTKRKFLAGG